MSCSAKFQEHFGTTSTLHCAAFHRFNSSALLTTHKRMPCQQNDDCQHQNHWNKYRAELIDHPLDRCFCCLRIFTSRMIWDNTLSLPNAPTCITMHPSPLMDATGEGCAHVFGYGKGLANEHGFIHLGMPLKQRSINRKTFAMLDPGFQKPSM